MSLTAPSPGLAGHQGGAAFDITLRDARGRPCDLGNEYAEGGAISSIDFPYITALQWETRTLVIAGMHMGGMKVLSTEDWHGSHGDRGMSADRRVTMTQAEYGPVADFDRTTGEIVPYEGQFIEGNFLTDPQVEDLVARSREKNGGSRDRYSDAELYRMFNPAEGFPGGK